MEVILDYIYQKNLFDVVKVSDSELSSKLIDKVIEKLLSESNNQKSVTISLEEKLNIKEMLTIIREFEDKEFISKEVKINGKSYTPLSTIVEELIQSSDYQKAIYIQGDESLKGNYSLKSIKLNRGKLKMEREPKGYLGVLGDWSSISLGLQDLWDYVEMNQYWCMSAGQYWYNGARCKSCKALSNKLNLAMKKTFNLNEMNSIEYLKAYAFLKRFQQLSTESSGTAPLSYCQATVKLHQLQSLLVRQNQ